MVFDPVRVLIFSASIGEGHDLPARIISEGIRQIQPGTSVETVDTLAVIGGLYERVVMGGSQFHSDWGGRMFDIEHKLITEVRPMRSFAGNLGYAAGVRKIAAEVAAHRPDVIVSTYPGATDVLGRLRRRGRLAAPVVSLITDLASLRYWAAPGVDLHLIIHPESEAEVREIAPGSEIACARGMTAREFYEPRDQRQARKSLGLPLDGPIVIVSGGGWAVGDIAGAVDAALEQPNTTVVCLCGRNDQILRDMQARFGADDRVVVMGFTDRIGDLFAASDVLVHSTAGLTVLEAIMRGCRVISYGWGRGHVRVNNAAYLRFGLAAVASDRAELGMALKDALAHPAEPDRTFEELPEAASLVLATLGDHARDGG